MKRKWLWKGEGGSGGSILIDYDADAASISNVNSGYGRCSIDEAERIISNFVSAQINERRTYIVELVEVEV